MIASTTSGVIGIVIGFALRNTIADLFTGIYGVIKRRQAVGIGCIAPGLGPGRGDQRGHPVDMVPVMMGQPDLIQRPAAPLRCDACGAQRIGLFREIAGPVQTGSVPQAPAPRAPDHGRPAPVVDRSL